LITGWHAEISNGFKGMKTNRPTHHRITTEVSWRAKIVAILPTLVLLASCSHPSVISREELHSTLRSSISFAADAEASLDYVLQGRSTQNFVAGHFHYMADELEQSVKQLNQSKPRPGTEQAFTNSQQDMKALASELRDISFQTSDSNAISAAKQRIGEIRRALEKTSSSL
jgi:hypothetical protein